MGLIIQNEKIYSGNAERGYREYTLWVGPATPANSGTDITLNDAISNYDEIVFKIDKYQNTYEGQNSFKVSQLEIGNQYISTVYTGSYQGAYWDYTGDTTIKIRSLSSSTLQTYLKIIGIKYSEVVAGSTFHKYSTTERVVGEWIDGKALYEKTVPFSTPSSNAYTRVTIASGVEMGFCDTSATFVIGSGQTAFLGSYVSNPNADQFVGLENIDSSNNLSLDYRVGTAYQNKQGYATFRYTKLSS